jgi:mono/diheme cytochrome c family protein
MKRHLIAGLVIIAGLTPAFAEGLRLPAITHEATKAECAACHMAFQPQMLPARSWQAIMGDLANHFGENAQLDAAVTADITAYLVANAGDAGGKKNGMMRRLDDKETPLRITEMPWWVRSHRGEVSDASFKRAGSKANCAACHRGAEQGYYEDD